MQDRRVATTCQPPSRFSSNALIFTLTLRYFITRDRTMPRAARYSSRGVVSLLADTALLQEGYLCVVTTRLLYALSLTFHSRRRDETSLTRTRDVDGRRVRERRIKLGSM